MCALNPEVCGLIGIGALILVLFLVSWSGSIGFSVLPWKWEIFKGVGVKKIDGDTVPSMDNVLEKLVKPYVTKGKSFDAGLIKVLKTYKKVLEDNKDAPDDFGTDDESDAYDEISDLVDEDFDKAVKVIETVEEKLPDDPIKDIPTENAAKEVVCKYRTEIKADFADMEMVKFLSLMKASTKGKKYVEFMFSNYSTLCKE